MLCFSKTVLGFVGCSAVAFLDAFPGSGYSTVDKREASRDKREEQRAETGTRGRVQEEYMLRFTYLKQLLNYVVCWPILQLT